MSVRHDSPQVLVVGAGIAGLTAAFRLQQAGISATVLERSDYAGGRIRTTDHDGFRIDRAASALFSCFSEIVPLISDAGLADEAIPCSDLAGIVQADRTVRFRTSSRLATPLLRSLPPRAIVPLLQLALRSVRHGRHLDWTVTPAAAALDTTDTRSLSRSQSRDLAEGILDPLIRGFTVQETDDVSSAQMYFVLAKLLGTRWLNARNGMRFLPEGLARQLDVRLSTEVTSIVEGAHGVTVTARPLSGPGPEQTLDAQAVVVTAPPPQALPLLPGISAQRRDLLARLRHIPAVVVHLGLDRPPQGEPAAWLVLQREHHGALDNVILDHNKAPGRVPPGRGLISLYWNGSWSGDHLDDDNEQLTAYGMQAADRLFPGISDQVRMAEVSRWPYALGSYPTGIFPLLQQIAQCEPRSRIRLAGDFLGMCAATNTAAATGAKAAGEIIGLLHPEKQPS